MKSSEQIYVSIDPQDYKKDKSLILNSQIDILNTIKHLQNIQKIRRNKTNLKSRLRDLSIQISDQIQSLQDKLPKVTIPKPKLPKMQQPIKAEKLPIIKTQTPQARNPIEDELREIQEKLRLLNS